MSVLKKQFVDQDVETLARERTKYAHQNWDRVFYSISGGKDSTVMMRLAIEVAREIGALPIEAIFFDEEILIPGTEDYMRTVAQMEEVDLIWACLPMPRVNAATRSQPMWYTWDPRKKDKWVREMPDLDCVITNTDVPEWNGEKDKTDNAYQKIYSDPKAIFMNMVGLRAQESFNRYRAVAFREEDNWISSGVNPQYNHGKPIYDMQTEDVWTLMDRNNWEYNKSYDLKTKMGVNLHQQRVAPPLGEQQIKVLYEYKKIKPEMWDKIQKRVPGADTAARYWDTEAYNEVKPLEGETYRESLPHYVNMWRHDHTRKQIKKSVKQLINYHHKRTNEPIQEENINGVVSWKLLCEIAKKGDLLRRNARQRINANADLYQ